jgi:hypothetical protein
VSTQLDAEDLLRAVAAALGLPATGADKGSLLSQVEQHLHTLAARGRRALLIVDEAQNLTSRAVEELRMLSNFQAGGKALLQSFLVGQPELRRILQGADMQQFRQRIIASYHLSPLDRAETQAYIEHRLRQVGWAGDPRMERGAYDAVFAFSGGIPRRINLVCNRVLLAGFLNERHVLDGEDVETVAREIEEELGAIGRPGEVVDPIPSAPADTSARHPETEWSELMQEVDDRPRPSTRPGTDPVQLLVRVSRLEKAVSRVLEMLRRRAG